MSKIKWKKSRHGNGVFLTESESCVTAFVMPDPMGGYTIQTYGGTLECKSKYAGETSLEDAMSAAISMGREHAKEAAEVLQDRISKIKKGWGV